MTPTLTAETIADLTQEIWSALLADHGELLPGDAAGGDVVAVAEIRGRWNGLVCFSCSEQAARRATAAMFDLTDDEVTAEEITDAVGELANVVSGNIKSLVPGPSVVSLPRVTDGEPALPPAHLDLSLEVRFSWMAEPVIVSVWTEAG